MIYHDIRVLIITCSYVSYRKQTSCSPNHSPVYSQILLQYLYSIRTLVLCPCLICCLAGNVRLLVGLETTRWWIVNWFCGSWANWTRNWFKIEAGVSLVKVCGLMVRYLLILVLFNNRKKVLTGLSRLWKWTYTLIIKEYSNSGAMRYAMRD